MFLLFFSWRCYRRLRGLQYLLVCIYHRLRGLQYLLANAISPHKKHMWLPSMLRARERVNGSQPPPQP